MQDSRLVRHLKIADRDTQVLLLKAENKKIEIEHESAKIHNLNVQDCPSFQER